MRVVIQIDLSLARIMPGALEENIQRVVLMEIARNKALNQDVERIEVGEFRGGEFVCAWVIEPRAA